MNSIKELIAALENSVGAGDTHEFKRGIDYAISLVNQLSEPAGWQDISTAPKDGTVIKCKGNEGRDYYARWAWSPNAQVNAWCGEVQGIVLPVTPPPTLWQPLPLPPAPSPEQKG